jgi:hypothetical protein
LPWLAKAADTARWNEFFGGLSSSNGDATEFRWFGLRPTGRTFGSGSTSPSSLQVMGKSLPPVEVVTEDDGPVLLPDDTADAKDILELQRQFYTALTAGNLEEMKKLFLEENWADEQVSSAMAEGGRLDDWSSCLADGARPANLKVADQDCTFRSATTAVSTCVEFVPTTTTKIVSTTTTTLLAVQTWKRKVDTDDDQHDWKLVRHETIPWTADRPAAGTLLCDGRGCVSLVSQTPEQRTLFGWLIG